MKNYLIYCSFGIAIFSVIITGFLLLSYNAEKSKIDILEEELSLIKNQIKTPNDRGDVAQQSISKMTNLGSFTNENMNSDSRLDNIEKEIGQLKSTVQKLSKSD